MLPSLFAQTQCKKAAHVLRKAKHALREDRLELSVPSYKYAMTVFMTATEEVRALHCHPMLLSMSSAGTNYCYSASDQRESFRMDRIAYHRVHVMLTAHRSSRASVLCWWLR